MKEGYERRRLRKEGGIIMLRDFFIGRVLLDLHRGEFEFCSREGLVQGAPVCWGFWAWGLGYPYGILELGSCPSWSVASSWARQQQEGQQDKQKVEG